MEPAVPTSHDSAPRGEVGSSRAGAPGMIRRLEAELRLLRRLSGSLHAGKLVETPALLKGLGGGDAELAMHRLLLLRRQHDRDPKVAAAFAAMGYGADGETVLERLESYAASQFVDARTVRRWSDAGIETLAAIILTAAPWIDPKILLSMILEDDVLVCRLEFTVPQFIGMRLPELRINETATEVPWRRVERPAESDYSRAATLDPQRLRSQTAIHLRWRGEIVPTYIVDVIAEPAWRVRSFLRLNALELSITRQTASLV